jgi:hypothetical protein
MTFEISNVVANLGQGYTAADFQEDTFFLALSNSVQPPQTLGGAGGQCGPALFDELFAFDSASSACWSNDPVAYSSCNSGGSGTCSIFNITFPSATGWSGASEIVRYCAYFSPSGTPSSAQLIQCTPINVTKLPLWSYGLELTPSVIPPTQFREGSTILIKMTGGPIYTNAQGKQPLVCNEGDFCYIGFGGSANAIELGQDWGVGALDVYSIGVTCPDSGTGPCSWAQPIYEMGKYAPEPHPNVSTVVSGSAPGLTDGCAWYLQGEVYNQNTGGYSTLGMTECAGFLASYSCPLVSWPPSASVPNAFNYNSIEDDACLLNSYAPGGTYQNNQNLTYEEPLSTQYFGTGNYLVWTFDYSDYCSKIDSSCGSDTLYLSPFFASMWVDCSNGYCTAYPSPQEMPNSTNQHWNVTNTSGNIGVYNSLNPNSYAGIACGVYGTINDSLFIFALLMMLLGAVLYAGSTLMPSTGRGPIQGYATGFIVVGVIAAVIASASVYALSAVNHTSLSNALSLCRAYAP